MPVALYARVSTERQERQQTIGNRYACVAPTKPSIQRGPRTAAATRRCFKPREQWITTPVPALADQGMWDRAHA